MKEKTISKFLDEDYLEYAQYVVENRAIPSVIDGLKPTQRKIIWISNKIWKSGSDKPMKVAALTGRLMADGYYHHGDCLSYDSLIRLSNGGQIKIGEWCEKNPDKSMEVICITENGEKTIGYAHSPRIGQITDELYEIELENGEIIKCTANHPFYINGEWIAASELIEGMKTTSINPK